MTRNKKILIGVGVVVILGALAFANFKFKRQDGIDRQHRDDPAARSSGDRVRLGQDPAATAGQHQRRHDGSRHRTCAVEEGQRVKKGQFLLQIDPRNLTSAVNQTAGVARGRALADGTAPASRPRARRLRLKQAQDCLRAAAAAVEGRPHDERSARQRREPAEDAAGGVELLQEQQIETQRLRMTQEQASLENAKLQPEQGPHRVADRRHHHPPQHRRGRDGRDRHDEQRRHGAAHGRRHVGHRGRSRGRRDRHPDRARSASRRRSRSTRCRARRSPAR